MQHGLVSAYVHMGAYICKVLEYTSQCRSGLQECTADYSFIGVYWKNGNNKVFPFDILDKNE